MSVTVDLAAAVICFAANCYPALVGADTPKGEFELKQYSTTLEGYGGDLLVFKLEGNEVFAVHRVLDIPGQQRIARLHSPYQKHRASITGGCVNVSPEVYEALVECCSDSKIFIR